MRNRTIAPPPDTSPRVPRRRAMPGPARTGVLIAAALASAGAALALEQPIASQASYALGFSGDTDSYANGEYTDHVALQVPAFRGLEPHLALAYRSGRGNGLFGQGWSLSGLGQIERLGDGHGAPRFDASDIFALDGQDLVPCAQGSVSPSCSSGGNYSTRIENYRRIKWDAAASAWTITDRDGTQYVYGYAQSVGGQKVRWALSAVRDTNGNTVSYGYAVDSNTLLPSTIAYNGTTIQFFTEARSDQSSTGIGAGVATLRVRVNSIVVKTGGNVVRAYKLLYRNADAAGASMLASVRMYGKDAVLDADQNITGGSALPARSFTYAPLGTGTDSPIQTSAPSATGNPGNAAAGWSDRAMSDVNGDGRADAVWLYGSVSSDQGTRVVYSLSNGDGTFAAQKSFAPAATGNYGNNAAGWDTRTMADVNGDGRADAIWLYGAVSANNGLRVAVSLANADGTFAALKTSAPVVSGNFAPAEGWSKRLMADVDGDGNADAVWLYASPAANDGTRVAYSLSNGDGSFQSLQSWSPAATGNYGNAPYGWDTQTMADVNGDGRMDAVWLYSAVSSDLGTRVAVSLARPDGSFAPLQSNAPAAGGNYGSTGWDDPVMADVNGDGKLDAVWQYASVSAGNGARVAYSLSQGNGTFAPLRIDAPTATGNYGAGGWDTRAMADVNGDGRADAVWLYSATSANNGTRVAISLAGADGGYLPLLTNTPVATGNFGDASVGWSDRIMADVDGNGTADAVWLYSAIAANNGERVVASTALGGPALLTKIDNGTGGSIAIDYEPSSSWPNTNNPPISQTVYAITTTAGAGGRPAVTRFSYSGGLYDRLDRRFLGFRYVQATLPATPGGDALYQQMWFKQDYGSLSKLEQIDRRSAGTGTPLLSREVFRFVTNGASVPYTSVLSSHWNYAYDGTGGDACPGINCKRRAVSYSNYDAYGNPTVTTDYGDYDVGGDESSVTTTYVSAPSAYVVGRPAVQAVVANGVKIAETQYCYDQTTSTCDWNKAPTRGNPTHTLRWSNVENAYVTEQNVYDGYGNVSTRIGATGGTRTFVYDTTYHLYPVSTKNALQQETITDWDTICGLPRTLHGYNGASDIAVTTYDNLCRPTGTTTPLGGFRKITYCALSSTTNQCGATAGANAQHTRVETPSADGNGNQWVDTYLDGSDRVWRTQRKGPAGAVINQDTVYNERGLSEIVRQPCYGCNTAPATVYTYDALGRVSRIAGPDGKGPSYAYGDWTLDVKDALGRSRSLTYNSHGLQTGESFTYKGVRYSTQYRYDALDRRTGITDAMGNVWTYGYDSLGNTISNRDPDRGTWTYKHYADHKPFTRTDAKQQVTQYTFDALGRRKTETLLYGTPNATTTTWSYDEVRSGFFNIGRPTSMLDASGSATYNYDLAGRRIQFDKKIGSYTFGFQQGFDAGGRLLWSVYPDGKSVGSSAAPRTYDGAGRPYAIPGIVTSATYRADGSPDTTTYANGDVRDYGYDAQMGWLTSIDSRSAAGTVLQDLRYLRRDDAGKLLQIASAADPASGWTFGYNERNQLVSAVNQAGAADNQTFDYDAAGNMTSNSRLGVYTYPTPGANAVRPHAVTKIGATLDYAYDANGSMTSRDGAVVVWNARNLVASVSGQSYTYDGEGWRVKKLGGSEPTYTPTRDYQAQYGYEDNTDVYVEFAGRTVAVLSRVHWCETEPGMHQCYTTNASKWLHADHLGSINVVTGPTGTVIQRQRHRPYGENFAGSGTSNVKRGFIDEDNDGTSGLIYQPARYYDPAIAKYLSADDNDPARADVGFSRYAYAIDDPANYIDDGGAADPAGGIGKVFGTLWEKFASPGMQRFAGWVIVADSLIEKFTGFSPLEYEKQAAHDRFYELQLEGTTLLNFVKEDFAFGTKDIYDAMTRNDWNTVDRWFKEMNYSHEGRNHPDPVDSSNYSNEGRNHPAPEQPGANEQGGGYGSSEGGSDGSVFAGNETGGEGSGSGSGEAGGDGGSASPGEGGWGGEGDGGGGGGGGGGDWEEYEVNSV